MEYYRLLGIPAGSSPEQIKNAFRARIKECHPDRVPTDGEKARRLIEAYRGLQRGESGPVDQEPVHAGPRRSEPEPGVRVQTRSRGYAAGAEAGRRIYEAIFKKADLAGSVENFWDAVHRSVLEEGEETEVFGRDVPIREVRWQNQFEGVTNPKARETLERAEITLREVVRKYDRQKGRSKRAWSKDYILGLTQVQVLFRDAMRRHPSLTGRSLSRLQQIHELISEIKKMAV